MRSFDITEVIGFLEDDMKIDMRNRNPYRIVLTGANNSEIIYFSCPIYSEITKKIIQGIWRETSEGLRFDGINVQVSVEEECITLKNTSGECNITFNEAVKVVPALNGIMVESECAEIIIKLRFDIEGSIISNSNYFVYLKEGLKPFFVFSCLYGKNKDTLMPLEIKYEQLNSKEYEIRFKTYKKNKKVCFDMNLYQSKCIFDTTVSSKKCNENNVYGEVAFLGFSKEYGEQWLYARIDPLKLSDIKPEQIIQADYYLPAYKQTQQKLKMHVLNLPWCSFGTTWINKNDSDKAPIYSENISNYKKLEVTHVIKELLKSGEPRNVSVLIRQDAKIGCTVVATGDNYSKPQILRIKVKGDFLSGNN